MQEQEEEEEEIEREEGGGAFFKGIINSLNALVSNVLRYRQKVLVRYLSSVTRYK